MKNIVLKKIGKAIKAVINYSNDKPYQSFMYNGKYIEGQLDTVRLYYHFGLSGSMKGKSLLDLGCNEGSLCLLAAQDGATQVTGVEISRDIYLLAKERAKEAIVNIMYYNDNVVDYIHKTNNKHDIVLLLAMFRHIHQYFMNNGGHAMPSNGRAYLLYNSYQTIILGHNNPVKKQFDEFIAQCISRANEFFICSFNDHSGMIARHPTETRKYFETLTDRIDVLDIYPLTSSNPEYTIIQIKLTH
jgi:cyclopropane fatty-acyl-phospholipid synthase-like methyltransferase